MKWIYDVLILLGVNSVFYTFFILLCSRRHTKHEKLAYFSGYVCLILSVPGCFMYGLARHANDKTVKDQAVEDAYQSTYDEGYKAGYWKGYSAGKER